MNTTQMSTLIHNGNKYFDLTRSQYSSLHLVYLYPVQMVIKPNMETL